MSLVDKAFYPKYGDNRQNIYEVNNGRAKEASKSVVCFVNRYHLDFDQNEQVYRLNENNKYNLEENLIYEFEQKEKKISQHKREFKVESGQRFMQEPCIGFGSGFLIAKNKVMTAWHVIRNDKEKRAKTFDELQEIYIVFDVVMKNENTVKESFPKKDFFRAIKIVEGAFQSFDFGKDYAIVELDRDVEDRNPVTFNFNSFRPEEEINLKIIGHPCGLPMKVVENGISTDYKFSEKFYESNSYSVDRLALEIHQTFHLQIASFCGNSGSPIFDKNFQVLGILIQGESDYEVERYMKLGCCKWLRYGTIKAKCVTKKNAERGEREVAQRIDTIKEAILLVINN